MGGDEDRGLSLPNHVQWKAAFSRTKLLLFPALSLFISCGLQNQLKFPYAQISLHKCITSCPVGLHSANIHFPGIEGCSYKRNLVHVFQSPMTYFSSYLALMIFFHFSYFVNSSSWLNKSVSYVDDSWFSKLKMLTDATNYYNAGNRGPCVTHFLYRLKIITESCCLRSHIYLMLFQ